jgi:hypothetical protein
MDADVRDCNRPAVDKEYWMEKRFYFDIRIREGFCDRTDNEWVIIKCQEEGTVLLIVREGYGDAIGLT